MVTAISTLPVQNTVFCAINHIHRAATSLPKLDTLTLQLVAMLALTVPNVLRLLLSMVDAHSLAISTHETIQDTIFLVRSCSSFYNLVLSMWSRRPASYHVVRPSQWSEICLARLRQYREDKIHTPWLRATYWAVEMHSGNQTVPLWLLVLHRLCLVSRLYTRQRTEIRTQRAQ